MDPEKVLERKKDFFRRISEWLEKHNGEMPRKYIIRDGKRLNSSEMTLEERREVKLAGQWDRHYKDSKEMYKKYEELPIEKVPEEYRIIVQKLKDTKNKPNKKQIKKVVTLVEWIKLRDGRFPKSSKGQVSGKTPEEIEEGKMYRIYRDSFMKEIEEKYENTPIEEIPEEYREYMELLIKHKTKTKIFEKMIDWLEKHEGKHPKFSRRVNGKRLNRPEMSEEELYEARLNSNWNLSDEKKILESYIGVPLEQIPEIYRPYIEKMRSFGYGLDGDYFNEIIDWLDTHAGALPRREITSEREKSSKEEIEYEKSLRKKWDKLPEKKILEEYFGIELEEIPEEYRERIAILRQYGIGVEEKECYEQIIEWLDTHNKELPRAEIRNGKKARKRSELSPVERKEVLLRYKWNVSAIKMILDGYAEEPLENVPIDYREKIQKLRSYGLGLIKRKEFDTYNEMVEWLKNNDGKYPRTVITNENGERKKAEEFTAQESYEISLSHRWYRTEERKIFFEYEGKSIEEVPEEYREKIAELRKYKKVQAKQYKKDIFIWLENHEGKLPRGATYKNGTRLKVEEMTPEQMEESRQYRSWKKSKLRAVLNEYAGRPIKEVPEIYREDVQKLRDYGHLGKRKDEQIKDVMKKSVVLQVSANDSARSELETEVQKETSAKEIID